MATPVGFPGRLSLHPDFSASVTVVGRERSPVIVVDNFLGNPELLIDYAAAQAAFEGVADTSYPGLRAPLPAIYVSTVRALVARLIADTYGLDDSTISGEFGYFSLVTTPPGQLSPLQCMPHIDETNPRRLAALHYLCDAAHGGTSFYRQRRTGFETVDEARAPVYRKAIVEEIATHGLPRQQYICGDNALFEQTASFAAAYNRLLIYRSLTLHSPDIHPGFSFDGDPRSGRLTANGFYFYQSAVA
jgi:hypothetical protein